MNLNERISLFSSLAEVLSGKINSTHEKVLDEAIQLNPWFTKENINDSLNSIVCMLDEDALTKPLYPVTKSDKKIDQLSQEYKEKLKDIDVSPFNHENWSRI